VLHSVLYIKLIFYKWFTYMRVTRVVFEAESSEGEVGWGAAWWARERDQVQWGGSSLASPYKYHPACDM